MTGFVGDHVPENGKMLDQKILQKICQKMDKDVSKEWVQALSKVG